MTVAVPHDPAIRKHNMRSRIVETVAELKTVDTLIADALAAAYMAVASKAGAALGASAAERQLVLAATTAALDDLPAVQTHRAGLARDLLDLCEASDVSADELGAILRPVEG